MGISINFVTIYDIYNVINVTKIYFIPQSKIIYPVLTDIYVSYNNIKG